VFACSLVGSDWGKLGEFLTSYDEKREGVIKRCRGALAHENGLLAKMKLGGLV
jgi:hypothetical protein